MTTIREIGIEGLQRLQAARVTVVGVGGVGSCAALYLSQAGVGHLRLIDQDIVEPSNLHRLGGMDQSHLYHPKAEAIAELLSRLTPWTAAEPIVDTLRATNVGELLAGSDIILDGLDNFRTRYIVNGHSVETSTPYVFTSAVHNQGHIGLFRPPKTSCLECCLPNIVDRAEDSCESLGVTPTITGMVGAFAASETVKAALGFPTRLLGSLLTIDALKPDFFTVDMPKREECQACGKIRRKPDMPEAEIPVVLCGGKTFNVLPQHPMTLDLRELSESIPIRDILTITNTVVVYRKNRATLTVFKTGRLLIEGVENQAEAGRIAREVWSAALGHAVPVA